METKVEEISEEDFVAYETVRSSGVTNMFAVNTVMELSDLSREKILGIMQNYDKLCKLYPDVRK